MLDPDFEQLVQEIHVVNKAWKQAANVLLQSNNPLAVSLRNLKNSLQVRLIRNYIERVYIELDTETESKEELYSIRFNYNSHYQNAAHIPVRVAQKYLTAEELTKLTSKY